MSVKFTSIKSSNQNIKLNVEIIKQIIPGNQNYESFIYENKIFFSYLIFIKSSEIVLKICPNLDKHFNDYKTFIGSYIYDIANKFSANIIIINCNFKRYEEKIIFEFLQKDFIYKKYLTNSNNSIYTTSYRFKTNLQYLFKSLTLLKKLVSEPSNIIYPESFVNLIKNEINKNSVKIKILNKAKIKKLGMRCLLAVNQGSDKEPRVIEFSKKKFNKNVDILFVGKGVCFDSGGISLKPGAGMEDMKWDMAGAAVVSSIIKYLSNIKTNFSYAGIIGLVENMPDGKAYKPGDVIKSYKGINVEVLNTDAEGRLVLADIISYGCDIFKPKLVIDFATLTGAIMVALGQHYAGLYSNDDNLASTLYNSGLRTNEKVWRMPLHEDFDKELNSPFVDLKNITNNRYGGSVTAAQFLQRFVPKNTKWAHLDIAGVTWKPNGDNMNNKGATGFGLTLISDFIDKYF